MSTRFGRRVSGVFDEDETRALRDAYRLALNSLALTHPVDERLEARLADAILRIFVAEPMSAHRNRIDALASRGVERYLTFDAFSRFVARNAALTAPVDGRAHLRTRATAIRAAARSRRHAV